MNSGREILFPGARLAGLAGILAGLAVFPALDAALLPLWLAALAIAATAAIADAVALPHRIDGQAVLSVARVLTTEPLLHGRPAQLAVDVVSASRWPLTVRVADSLPAAFELLAEPAEATLPARGRVRLTWEVLPRTRGAARWERAYLFWRTRAGLFERRQTLELPAEVKVYPDVAAILSRAGPNPRQLLARLGVKPAAARGAGMDFESLREFQPGDDVGRVDWKATARRGLPVTRLYQVETNHEILLALDTGRLMLGGGDLRNKLDFAVDAALVLAVLALGQGDRVGLVTFAERVERHLQARRQKQQLAALVASLYDVEARPLESDYRRLLVDLGRLVRKRALIVVFTDFMDTEGAREMLAILATLSKRHLILFVAVRDPAIDARLAAEVRQLEDVAGKVVAYGMLDERRLVLEELGRSGVTVIDAAPSAVMPQLVSRYLDLRPRL